MDEWGENNFIWDLSLPQQHATDPEISSENMKLADKTEETRSEKYKKMTFRHPIFCQL